jgi:SAM-dependent methyltransferase
VIADNRRNSKRLDFALANESPVALVWSLDKSITTRTPGIASVMNQPSIHDRHLSCYLSGRALYGDDFSIDEIADWFEDEQEGYAELGAKVRATYVYGYHALNEYHGFRHLPSIMFERVLGFGSAYGDEFQPIIDQIHNLVIVDPSDAFVQDTVLGVPASYVKPQVSGVLPFHDAQFDLVTCLDVLHHIPNVNTVVNELARCTRPGGYALIREPIISMGDWTRPRLGLTQRERGIPQDILGTIVRRAGFGIVTSSYCMFPLLAELFGQMRISAYNHKVTTIIDALLSSLFSWNIRYHAVKLTQKIRPRVIFLVLRKS